MQHGRQAHTNEVMVRQRPGPREGDGRRGPVWAPLDGAFVVQAVIGLAVRHAVLFIEQVGRLVWQPIVQLRKSQFNFSVFTV